jgi:hypothetical protein
MNLNQTLSINPNICTWVFLALCMLLLSSTLLLHLRLRINFKAISKFALALAQLSDCLRVGLLDVDDAPASYSLA